MDERELKALLDKFNAGTANASEKAQVESWYNQLPLGKKLPSHDQILTSKAQQWEGVVLRIRPVHRRILLRIGVAAAVAIMVLGVWFFNYRSANTPRHPELVSGSHDIAPGKMGATLTLANGQVIALSGDKKGVVVGKELKYDDGSSISSLSQGDISPRGGERNGNQLSPSGRDGVAREGSWVVATTAKGQTYQVTLPDGSKVWLNA
ncbi:MAG: hypothetical protein EOO88_61060, partial [Pedobacter sp.]